jgi:hypothetical protein
MAKNRLKTEGALDQSARLIINHNFSDVSLSTSQLDITSSTTLTNIPGLVTDTLTPGATYKFRCVLPTVCTANNGSKFAFKQGAASMVSSIEYEAKAFTASGVAVSRGTTTTDQTLILDNASAVVILAEITGVVTLASTQAMYDAAANGTLTLQLQAAEHTSHADTFSVFKNAQMQFEHITTG